MLLIRLLHNGVIQSVVKGDHLDGKRRLLIISLFSIFGVTFSLLHELASKRPGLLLVDIGTRKTDLIFLHYFPFS